MKRNILVTAILLAAGSLLAAEAKDELAGAAKKLADASNYSWTTTVTNAGGRGGGGGGGGRRGGFGGPGAQNIQGKIEKGGYIVLTFGAGENTMQGVVKGDKGALQTPDGWQALAELTADNGGGGGGGGGRGRGMMMARRLQNTKGPAVDVTTLLGKVKSVTKSEDGYAAELTEEGAKSLLTFGPGRGGGNGPEIDNPKATAKFWVKDGVLAKYETHATGTMTFNGNEINRDTTTTVEIKNVGNTKVEVPNEAKKKLES
jgi:hypothetical protein